MTEGFIQLKKQAAKRCFVLSALFGGSAATWLLGVLFLVWKLWGKSLPWWGYAGLSIGVGILVAGLVLLALYPTVKRFTRYLDTRYGLNERVQTMVEFSKREGAVVALQRADTDAKLAALPPHRYGAWKIVALSLAPIFAAATLASSFFLPSPNQPAPTPPPVQPPKQEELAKPTEYAVEDLKKLIENVKASELSTPLKTVNVTVLEGLLTDLEGDGEVEKSAVGTGMLTILTATVAENSYNAFVTASKGQEVLASLSKAFKESAKAYDGIPEANVYDYSTLKDKRPKIDDKVTERWLLYANNVKAEISVLHDINAYLDFVNGYLSAFELIFAAEGIAALSDSELLKGAVERLRSDLADTLNATKNGLAEGVELAGAKSAAENAFALFVVDGAHSAGVAVAMNEQAYVYMMKDYVLLGLSKIFGVPVPEIESEEEDNEPPVDGGGGGGGAFNYPNEGLVLDPATGLLKPYGELLADYYARVLGLLEQDGSQASEELKGYILAYFGELH